MQVGNWSTVWQRFAESPTSYPHIPDRLREAKPEKNLHMFDTAEPWPQDNDRAEEQLRTALLHLGNSDPEQARQAILRLENDHSHRRNWVWHTLNRAPMARAIEHLARIAEVSQTPQHGVSVQEAIHHYTDRGWTADLALLDALAAVDKSADTEAVQSAVRAVYRPWLQDMAASFQKLVADSEPGGYQAMDPVEAQTGTCILFTDGLRFDIAQRLASFLNERSIETEVKAGLTAIPSVTATAKPALSPVGSKFEGSNGLDTAVMASGPKTNAGVLRNVLSDEGFQILRSTELGNPAGRGWTELGDVDSQGHSYGSRVSRSVTDELKRLAERVANLLDSGWKKVVVITDHGWLMIPGGLPKADLPEHLTEVRKGRCARLKEGAITEFQTVPWHWDSSVRIAVAPGIHCYEAGREYEHGGLSPQECIVPILTASRSSLTAPVEIANIRWRGLRCYVEANGAIAGNKVDLRFRANDPSSTIVKGGGELDTEGNASSVVENEDLEEQAAIVVVVGPDGTVLAQGSTIIGGP